MNYDCALIKDLLTLYHDKATSETSTKLIEEHLDACTECRLFYDEIKKSTGIRFKPPAQTDGAGSYVSLAKRLRRTKWYWRIGIGLLIGCVISLSLMFADGNRFDPKSAAYASNVINKSARLLAAVPMGTERVLYIYDDDGQYLNVSVIYRFPFWKYNYTWPNRYVPDPDAQVELATKQSYANSNNQSLYFVYAVAVHDDRVASIELGKEGIMQHRKVDSELTVFFWDKTGDWDGTGTWPGMIRDTELQGTAYAEDGTALYSLTLVHENGQDAFQWNPAE